MTRESRRVVQIGGVDHEPYYCASCGVEGGESIRAPGNFIFWICDKCHATHGPIVAAGITPLAPERQRICDAQLESHGRLLSLDEIKQQLSDVNSPLSKLARDFAR